MHGISYSEGLQMPGTRKPESQTDGLITSIWVGMVVIGAILAFGLISTNNKLPVSVPQPEVVTFEALNSAQHLAIAKEKLLKVEKLVEPYSNSILHSQVISTLSEARKHLQAIPQDDGLYTRAKPLVLAVNAAENKEKDNRRKHLAEMERIAEKILTQKRANYAQELENQLLGQGMDAYVRVSGYKNQSLSIEYALMSRPVAFSLRQDDALWDGWKSAGFKRVTLMNRETEWVFILKDNQWEPEHQQREPEFIIPDNSPEAMD
jgi:hypothetical protein